MKNTNVRQDGRFGLLMVILASILWGTIGIAVRAIYIQSETNPLSIGFLRLAISAPVLLLACLRTLGWQMFQITKRDLSLMLLTGVMTALFQVCYVASVSYVGVAAATIVTFCTVPIWVAILASLLLRERFTLAMLLALVCAVGGTVLLIDVRLTEVAMQSNTVVGVLLAVASALGYASVTLCSRFLAKRNHPLQSLTIGFLSGAIFLLPIAIVSGLVVRYSLVSWASLLYLGIVPTALAYLLFFSGMRYISTTVASVTALLEPLVSTVLAWWLFNEQLSSSGVIGGVFLLIAIGILYWENCQKNKYSSEEG